MKISVSLCLSAVLICFAIAPVAHTHAKPLRFDLFADVTPGNEEKIVRAIDLVRFNNRIYFVARHHDAGFELWQKPGDNKPELVHDINPGYDSSFPEDLQVVDNDLYFTGVDDSGVRKLWRIDSNDNLEALDILYQTESLTETLSESAPLDILSYHIGAEQTHVMAKNPADAEGKIQLWQFTGSGQVTLMDDAFPSVFDRPAKTSSFQEPVLSYVFEFNGDIFAYMHTYSNITDEDCVFRRYPSGIASEAVDLDCGAMAHDDQLAIMQDKVYLMGDDGLLTFDGEFAPTLAFGAEAAIGDMKLVEDTLYVATYGLFPSRRGSSATPFVYSVDDSGLRVIRPASDSNDEQVVLNTAIDIFDGVVWFADTIGQYAGDYWQEMANRIARYDLQSNAFTEIAELTLQQAQISYFDNLLVDQGNVCFAEQLSRFYCLDSMNNFEFQTNYEPLNSFSNHLTILGEDLAFYARWALDGSTWKSNGEETELLTTEGDYSGLNNVNNQLFMESGVSLYRFETDASYTLINESVPGFPAIPKDLVYADNAIYVLFEEDEFYDVLQFDGNESMVSLIQLPKTAVAPKIHYSGSELFVSLSRDIRFDDESQQCSISVLRDGEQQMVAEANIAQELSCYSAAFTSQDTVFSEFTYSIDGSTYSSLGELTSAGVNWLWRDQNINLIREESFAFLNEGVYFCSDDPATNINTEEFVKLTDEGVMTIIEEDCPNKIVVSDFAGQDELFASYSGRNGLYRLNDNTFDKVTGENSTYLSEVRDIIEFQNGLILSTNFADLDFSYGHELVRVSVINSDIVFSMGDEDGIEFAIPEDADSFVLDEQLTVLEDDEGDTIRWSLLEAPQNGTVTGLPFEMVSDGQPLMPEQIGYQPNSGFVGNDSFTINVTDGFSQDSIQFNVTVVERDQVLLVKTDDSSGGSVGFIFLLLPMVLLRLNRLSVGSE